ncbi:hypothetical protein [Streptomyces indicus]|uniref:Heavy-metal-associated domain-containing protein n=1 Tax=Streptomyces indicus TaxID=417292 RepID=A0A1G9HVS6_9ACTN|nr:hypothetical protein [Streptomyces indicus]SDL17059.1 hypothetical protein SAMN05421806_12072 [Streptomyces indicus]
MKTALRITAFAAALGATFGTAYAVGSGLDPVIDKKAKEAAAHTSDGGHDSGGGGGKEGEGHGEQPAASGAAYRIGLKTPRLTADQRGEIRFAIEDEAGRPLTSYTREHGKELHLIVASRDLTVYRHLHPERDAQGVWSTPVELPEAGSYRIFADFKAKGAAEGTVQAAEVAVAGPYKPKELPKASPVAKVDGYEVRLNGALKPGKASELVLSVSKDGKPVKNLQPYLGAYGHLVALREGDLEYLHVHPNEGPAGPDISFTAETTGKGSYRLFLDFQHEGKVRTAAFTVHADGAVPDSGPGSGSGTGSGEGSGEEGGHGH